MIVESPVLPSVIELPRLRAGPALDGVRSDPPMQVFCGRLAGLGARAAHAQVVSLRIVGVSDDVIEGLRIRDGQLVVYDLKSSRDAAGRIVSAGALISAMARMDRGSSLSIRTTGLALTLQSMCVEVDLCPGRGRSQPALAVQAQIAG